MVKFLGNHIRSRESQQHVSNVWTKDKIEPVKIKRKCEWKCASAKNLFHWVEMETIETNHLQACNILFHRNTWSETHGFVNGDQVVRIHDSMHKTIQKSKENALTTCKKHTGLHKKPNIQFSNVTFSNLVRKEPKCMLQLKPASDGTHAKMKLDSISCAKWRTLYQNSQLIWEWSSCRSNML